MEEEKENNRMIRKKIFENLIIAIVIMLYFILLNFSYTRLEENLVTIETQIASLIILALSIIIFEFAYHKDSGKLAIYGIEVLILAFNTLTVWNIAKKINISFYTYILFSTYSYVIYYILKSILIYTNEKRKFLKSLSDIHEIVSKEPIKKQAQKRKVK